jgi:Skp family chaperone for outer membrane proteins
MVRASFLQIYNENIWDLLKSERTSLQIREDKKKGVFVEGLSEWAVRSPSEVYSLIEQGSQIRATASTKMNDVSSRSHAVFIIIVEQMRAEGSPDEEGSSKEIRIGKLNMVDLAGSERVRVSGAKGVRLDELKKINQSLTCLGNVIAALSDPKHPRSHIPYRDSKLTRILEDSLGGNCKTTMMAMISPALDAFSESLSTLRFANRAKNIKNAPIINEDVGQKALLRKYEGELKKLRQELSQKSKHLTDMTKLTKLEEEKRRAEEDREAALQALESRSKEFFSERQQKKQLEEKIRAMNSQVLVGGKKPEETPQFKNALAEQQKLIWKQYEAKVQDLEKERQSLNEDKAQVDKYKQLLLKQRDIMIALTTRLNERDETIIQLQEELDAIDNMNRDGSQLKELKDKKMAYYEQLLTENGINFTPMNSKKNEKAQKENISDPLKTISFIQKGMNIHTQGSSSRIRQLEEENSRLQRTVNSQSKPFALILLLSSFLQIRRRNEKESQCRDTERNQR